MEGLKSLTAAETQSLNRTASARPLRASTAAASGRMERIMQRCMKEVASAHMEFLGKVIEAIGGNLDDARKQKAVAVHERGCKCCNVDVIITKRVGPSPTEVGLSVDRKINQAADQLFNDIWGVGTDIHAQTPIQRTLYELTQEALADGYAQAEAAWNKRAAKDEEWALSNPFPLAPIRPTPDMVWLQNVYADGFTNVKDKVFQQLTPSIKQSIVDQVAAGLSVSEISKNLYSSFGPGGVAGPFSTGSGYLWQWQRLVRTECHNAVFTANNEEFKDCGAEWVKWSKAVNSCKICDGLASRNQGYYDIDDVPRPPHPNCRCSTNPVFNLPVGVANPKTGKNPTPPPTEPEPNPLPLPKVPVGAPGTGTGKVTFKGKHKMTSAELAELEAHANEKLKELGINDDITINIFTNAGSTNGYVKIKEKGISTYDMYLKDRSQMGVDKNGVPALDKMKQTVTHELTHVQQVNTDKLYTTKTGWNWEGSEYVSHAQFAKNQKKMRSRSENVSRQAYNTYRAYPWEVEARLNAGQD